jgi:hypothetical protein
MRPGPRGTERDAYPHGQIIGEAIVDPGMVMPGGEQSAGRQIAEHLAGPGRLLHGLAGQIINLQLTSAVETDEHSKARFIADDPMELGAAQSDRL